MRFSILLPTLLMLAAFTNSSPKPVTFSASDGAKAYGEFYSTGDRNKPIILLFHMFGSNSGEYSSIAPKLVQAGFNALAADLRGGGRLWGKTNRTVANSREKSGSRPKEIALKDMEGSVRWAQANNSGPVIVWGSSYSASLVFLLAAEHPEIRGLLAFSPGEYFGGKTVHEAAENVHCAVFLTSANTPEEEAEAKSIFESVPSKNKTLYVPGGPSVHGSSTLREDRNPPGADANWRAVNQFLAQLH